MNATAPRNKRGRGTHPDVSRRCVPSRVEDISEATWGTKVSPGTISNLNKKAYENVSVLVAIHAQEDREAVIKKSLAVAEKLREMKLSKAAKKVEKSIHETLTYMHYPTEHWLRIRTNNTLKGITREIRRRTGVVGTFPDGESALMLICARLRYVARQSRGAKRYLNMSHLSDLMVDEDGVIIE